MASKHINEQYLWCQVQCLAHGVSYQNWFNWLTDGCVGGWMEGGMDGELHGWGGWMEEWVGGWVGGWIDEGINT
jgi:hypothetical protein